MIETGVPNSTCNQGIENPCLLAHHPLPFSLASYGGYVELSEPLAVQYLSTTLYIVPVSSAWGVWQPNMYAHNYVNL